MKSSEILGLVTLSHIAIIFDFSCDDSNTQEQEVLLGAIGNKGYAKF